MFQIVAAKVSAPENLGCCVVRRVLRLGLAAAASLAVFGSVYHLIAALEY